MDDAVVLELKDPVTSKRLDAVFFGTDRSGTSHAVILELKQWDSVEALEGSSDLIVANTHGATRRPTQHPSMQANCYANRLRYWVADCASDRRDGIVVTAYAYLYNMAPQQLDVITRGEYTKAQDLAPALGAGRCDVLRAGIRKLVQNGRGLEVLQRLLASEVRPSKRFVEKAVEVIGRRDVFPLIPEQCRAQSEILRALRVARESGQKTVLIVEGGPGSGKTAVALQTVSDVLADNLHPRYVVKSAAMKVSIQSGLGDDLGGVISFTDRFGYEDKNKFDVILVDEAHRIDGVATIDWSTGRRHYKTREKLSKSLSIVQEIVRAGRVTTFFLDERQIIQPEEANRVANIEAAAEAEGAKVVKMRLETQHRLCGSQSFLDWVDAVLSPTPTARSLPDIGLFEFRVVDDPRTLVAQHDELDRATPNSARLLTGWCWDWSQKPNPDGSLKDEVVVPDLLSRPWEAPKHGKPGRLANHIARGELWATHPSGSGSFGSVYTAQGFDVPNVCLLWPRDLLMRNGSWTGNPSRDRTKRAQRGGFPNYDNVDPKLAKLGTSEIVPYLLNVYRILMTRATKRLFVAFLDDETREFFQSMT